MLGISVIRVRWPSQYSEGALAHSTVQDRQGLDWPDLSLDHKGDGGPGVERSLPHPIFFRGGATHYSDGEGSLTIHMVRDFSLDHKDR